VLPAIADATDNAVKVAIATAITPPARPSTARPRLAGLCGGQSPHQDPARPHRRPFEQILKTAQVQAANGEGNSGAIFSDPKARNYSTHSFGAQFVEVEWDPGIARLRVSRVVSVIDGGRIINRKTATNQILGAVVMGVGMGMLEETIYDHRNGLPINSNFADYMVATHADSPKIDVTSSTIPTPFWASTEHAASAKSASPA
jgi:xanthine dehydrogenase YagR molybdenum-binding subunit